MANAFVKEAVKFISVLQLMVKIARNKKPSLLIVPLLAVMQSLAVNVKEKIILMKATTTRIPLHLALGSHLRCVIPPYLNRQTAFNSW